MPTVPRQEAVKRLAGAVAAAGSDDLVEIYNELFPSEPIGADRANSDRGAIIHTIVGHIANGLEVEEIVDLWNVIFPAHRDVWFDEDEDLMHYDETIEPVGQAD